MKNNLLVFFVTLGILANSTLALADEVKTPDCSQADNQTTCLLNQGTGTPAAVPSTLQADGTYDDGRTPATTQSAFGSAGAAGTGAYTQASNAKDSANTAMLLGLAMAAMFGSQCGPTNQQACMLAGVAAAAAMVAAMKKSQAQNLMNTLGNTNTTGTGTTTTPGSDSTNNEELNHVRDQLAAQGYKLNDDGTMTAPNGTTLNAGNMNKSSLESAGLNSSDANGVLAGIDKMKKEMADKMASKDGSDSGTAADGGGLSGTYGGGDKRAGEAGKGNANGGGPQDINRDPAAWDGYYKQYGDSLIGVAQNDIFMMVQKRVESERKGMGY